MNNKIDLSGIDLLKFIMAIFVVAIHTQPFRDFNDSILLNIWDKTMSLAVPFFFIASGYFLFLKVYNNSNKSVQIFNIKTYKKRIIELYLFWTIIHLPIIIWYILSKDLSIGMEIILFIRRFFLIGDHHYAWQLWYLLCMIYSLSLINFLMIKNQKIKSILFISILIFFISILINFIIKFDGNNKILLSFGKLMNYAFRSGRLFSGMFYMMIGAIVANQKINISNFLIIIFVLIGVLFQSFYIPFISELTFVLLPFAVFLISLKIKLGNYINGYFFRKCSTIIYFSHLIILFLFSLLFIEFKYFGFYAFLASTTIPILFTPIILKFQNRIIFLKKIF